MELRLIDLVSECMSKFLESKGAHFDGSSITIEELKDLTKNIDVNVWSQIQKTTISYTQNSRIM